MDVGDDPAGSSALPVVADAEVFAYQSLRALYQGDWRSAESFAESAAARSSELGKAYVYGGICAAHRGDLAAAEKDWETLARLYPELRPPIER